MDEMASLPIELNRLEMSYATLRVLNDLWRYADPNAEEPFVVRSRDAIENGTGMKRNTMTKAVNQLVRSGLIREGFGDNGDMSGPGFSLSKSPSDLGALTRHRGHGAIGPASQNQDQRPKSGTSVPQKDQRPSFGTSVPESGPASSNPSQGSELEGRRTSVLEIGTSVPQPPSTLNKRNNLIVGGTSASDTQATLGLEANDALGESPKTGTPQLKPPPKTNQRLLVEARRHGYTPEKTEKLWARQNELRSQAATRLGIKCRPLTMSATGHGRIIGCLAEPFSYDQLEKCLEHRARSCDKASFRTFWDGVKNWTLASIRRDIDQIDSKGTHVHREASSRQRNSITVGCANEAGSGRRAKPEIWTSESVDVGAGK